MATERPRKEEKEEKMDFGSGISWAKGSLFGDTAPHSS